MTSIVDYISQHTLLAPWLIFFLILLAGVNIPISIDILLVVTAVLAATTLSSKAYTLFFCFTSGCICSAWISYWLGRLFGKKFLKISWVSRLLPQSKVDKVFQFYKRHGFWAFLVGRFIPFGIRNCLFLSTGMVRVPFFKFVLYDFIACTLWSTVFFFSLFHIGQNYEILLAKLNRINIFLFIGFSVTVIGWICYKISRRKKTVE